MFVLVNVVGVLVFWLVYIFSLIEFMRFKKLFFWVDFFSVKIFGVMRFDGGLRVVLV